MNIRIPAKLAALVAGLLIGASQPAAAAIAIAQVPLFIAAGVTPNVMILFDNSGSMDNIMWHPGFDPTATVPSWAPMIDHDCNTGTALRQAWAQTDGNLGLSTLISANYRGTCAGSTNTAPTCPSNHVRGRNGLVTKCLRLPDPVGGSTRYNGKYLDWLFQNYGTPTTVVLPTTTDLRGGTIIPDETRIEVARNVATTVVTTNSNLRIGLARFNAPITGDSAPGGRVIANCGVDTATLTTAIGGLTASANTPLAETYYEVTRYFRGLSSQWNAGVTYTSPIQYRCQKNFVVVITDGFPTWDATFPNTDPADAADAGRALPNWDGLAPATAAADFPDFPQFSDGTLTGSAGTEGFSLYLDDLAKFGYDIDLRTTGTDDTGVSYNETGKFQQQNLVTYTIGLTVNNQMMADAAEYGNGVYYQANDEEQLTKALQSAFADIEARTSSASAVATNSTRLSSETFIFQARFATSNWAGELLAFPILGDGSIGTRAWNAAEEIPDAGDRAIYTYDPTAAAGSRGREFAWANLNTAQQTELNKTVAGTADTLGDERVDYLRGDRGDEAPNGAGFRARSTASVLGDIVNSDPAFVAAQDFGFDKLPGSEGGSYKAFRSAKTSREAVVYVAANDGMLHAFRAEDGVELFGYIPNAVIPQLRFLTDASFNTSHRLLNDGGPRVLDAYLGGSWKTILLGSLGGGGRGIYALDVTNPDTFGTGSVMWEFTDAQDTDMGVAIPQPTIARLNNGDWAAIVANGYNSASGEAKLFILNLATGAIIREIGTGVSGDNGLSSPVPVDVDGDRIADYVYAGDLKGNLWKFDLTAASAGSWAVAFNDSGSPAPLWTACSSDPCTTGNRQAITARPEVGINPPAGFMVYFGTGRYFAVGDNSAASGGDNTFYAIRDRNDKQTATPERPSGLRSKLVEQELIAEIEGAEFVNDLGTAPTSDDVTYVSDIRVTSRKPIVDEDDGWFFDLPSAGERQVSTPILRNGRIIFTTLIPSGDACSAGGTSWLMEMDALSGGRLSFSPFDLNEDGEFTDKDFVTVTIDGEEVRVPTSGIRSTEGIIKTPAIITLSRDRETKKASGSSGGIFGVDENAGDQRGRMSWREVEQ